jgi:hypothetical protein
VIEGVRVIDLPVLMDDRGYLFEIARAAEKIAHILSEGRED